MPISMYQASVPVFLHGLKVLSHLLRKGETHVRESGGDPDALVEARLAPDMMPLSAQVQRASDTAKLALERITGVASPHMPDTESSFAELYARIDKTIAFLNSFAPPQFDGAEMRTIELNLGDYKPVFTGASYLLGFALPNFFFHVTTAYDILRHNGIPIGKIDYLRLKER